MQYPRLTFTFAMTAYKSLFFPFYLALACALFPVLAQSEGSKTVKEPSSKEEGKSNTATKSKKTRPTEVTLKGAYIYKRDCLDRFFLVVINKHSYVILFNQISGDKAKNYHQKLEVCRRHIIGFQQGDKVDVVGTLIERNGQKALYNASITEGKE